MKNKLNAKNPLIWVSSLLLAGGIFVSMSLMGFNGGGANVVRAGAFEIDPQIVKWLTSFASVFVIPLLNSKWPGLGAMLSKLLNIFVDPAEEEVEEVKVKSDADHFCDLHEIGLRFASNGDKEGVKLSTQMFERMLENCMAPPDEVEK